MIQCHSRFNLQIETWIEILGCSIANRLRVHVSASSNFISSGTRPQLPLKGRTSGHTYPAESECRIRPARNPPQRLRRRVFHIHAGTRSRRFDPIGESALCCTFLPAAVQYPLRCPHSAHIPCTCRRQLTEIPSPCFGMCRHVRCLESALHPALHRPSPKAAA